MSKKIIPEDLQDASKFELMAEVSHQNLREFIVEQIQKEKKIIRIYSIYQIIIMLVFTLFLTKNIVLAIKGHSGLILPIGLAIVFSFTLLIIIHEVLHALAYLLIGARKISFGGDLKKFVFYALADQQVVASRAFHIVALTPFVVVKLICLLGCITFYNEPAIYFTLTVMCLHSLFCSGDIAMLAFYKLNRGKEIYNFDNRNEGKTYFYARKN